MTMASINPANVTADEINGVAQAYELAAAALQI